MRALLDVNVLIALLDSDHAHHSRAWDWFAAHASSGWASCPLTQNGCVRIMAQSAYPNRLPISDVIERLSNATAAAQHAFWPDDVSLLDSSVIDRRRVHGSKQVTDLYLLALAVSRKGRLATFDANVPTSAVRGATQKNLIVI